VLLEVCKLRGGYGKGDVCKGICCSIDRGEILSVLGPNGCGKTTFFRLLLGILRPTGGDIRMDGSSIMGLERRRLSKLIAYIPQQHVPIFAYTVLDIVLMGRGGHTTAFQTPGEKDRQAAFAALEKLKISHLAHQKYTALSGGQRQLVLIARAVCQDAKVLIMDEPGASLDYANQQLLINVLMNLASQGYGIILSTHSPEHPFSVAHKVLLMKEGRVAAFGPPEEAITRETLEGVYGIAMDVVSVDDRGGRRHTFCLPVSQQY
jgi:iron complex transport system ATP-binding protein